MNSVNKMLIIIMLIFIQACSSTSSDKNLSQDAKNFAANHYSREKQFLVESFFLEHFSELNHIYTSSFFDLDETNTDDFYEDIAKYDKYLFGWDDWFEKYVDYDLDKENKYSINKIYWVCTQDGRWIGNKPIDNHDIEEYDTPYSKNREAFKDMVEDYFSE